MVVGFGGDIKSSKSSSNHSNDSNDGNSIFIRIRLKIEGSKLPDLTDPGIQESGLG